MVRPFPSVCSPLAGPAWGPLKQQQPPQPSDGWDPQEQRPEGGNLSAGPLPGQTVGSLVLPHTVRCGPIRKHLEDVPTTLLCRPLGPLCHPSVLTLMLIALILEFQGSRDHLLQGLAWWTVPWAGHSSLSFSGGNVEMFKSLNKRIQRFMGCMTQVGFLRGGGQEGA